MKALNVLSAKKPDANVAQVQTLFDLVSTNGPPREVDADAFSTAFGTAIREIKGETEGTSKPPDVRKTPVTWDSAAVDVHFLPDSGKNEFLCEYCRGRDEAAQAASAGAADPGVRSQMVSVTMLSETGVPQLSSEMAEFAGEIHSAIVAPPRNAMGAFPQDMSVARYGEAPLLDAVAMAAQGLRAQAGDPVIASPSANAQEADKMMIASFTPGRLSQGISQPGHVLPANFSPSEMAEGEFENSVMVLRNFRAISMKDASVTTGEPGSDSAIPSSGSPIAATAYDEVFHGDGLPNLNRPAAAAVHDETFHGGGFQNLSRSEKPLSSVNIVSPTVSLKGGLQEISPEQLPQAAVVRQLEVGYERLFDQLVQGVRTAQHAEASEIHVHLKPDFLGRLRIRVLADDYGMHIEIKTESEIVRQVMQDNLADLQQRLAEKGFAFNQFSLLADTGWASRREPEWPFEPPAFGPEGESKVTTETVAEPAPLMRSGVIDYIA